MAPKARKTFFLRKFGVRERTFCISPPPGHLCGPYFKVTARPNNGNPAVLFSQCYKPHRHRGSVSKEVPPAGYVSYFVNHSGIWREIVPCTSLSEKGSGHKNAKKRPETPNLPRNHDKRRKTAAAPPNIPCTSLKTRDLAGRRTCTLRFCQFLTYRSGV